jgi:hypothetical protein
MKPKLSRKPLMPTRLAVAWHVLCGRPAIYRINATRPIFIANKDYVFIADCDFSKVKDSPSLFIGAPEENELP